MVDQAVELMGVPMTVTPPGGAAVTTRGYYRAEGEIQREGAYTADIAPVVSLPVADVGMPVRDTEITDGASTWLVDGPAVRNGYKVTVVVRDAA